MICRRGRSRRGERSDPTTAHASTAPRTQKAWQCGTAGYGLRTTMKKECVTLGFHGALTRAPSRLGASGRLGARILGVCRPPLNLVGTAGPRYDFRPKTDRKSCGKLGGTVGLFKATPRTSPLAPIRKLRIMHHERRLRR